WRSIARSPPPAATWAVRARSSSTSASNRAWRLAKSSVRSTRLCRRAIKGSLTTCRACFTREPKPPPPARRRRRRGRGDRRRPDRRGGEQRLERPFVAIDARHVDGGDAFEVAGGHSAARRRARQPERARHPGPVRGPAAPVLPAL